jgi:Gas vesicle protein G
LLIVDRMLVGGIKFVLGKVAAAADAELNDEGRLREELLAAQMRLELGEIGTEEFAAFEADVLARLRDIRERQRASAGESGEMKVTGVDATVELGKE